MGPGDKVVVVYQKGYRFSRGSDKYIGMVGTITGNLRYAPLPGLMIEKSFPVEFADGHSDYFVPAVLRRIDPDEDCRKVGSWDECPWTPKGVRIFDPFTQ